MLYVRLVSMAIIKHSAKEKLARSYLMTRVARKDLMS